MVRVFWPKVRTREGYPFRTLVCLLPSLKVGDELYVEVVPRPDIDGLIPSETFHNAILAREAFAERISRLKAAGWEEVPEKV